MHTDHTHPHSTHTPHHNIHIPLPSTHTITYVTPPHPNPSGAWCKKASTTWTCLQCTPASQTPRFLASQTRTRQLPGSTVQQMPSQAKKWRLRATVAFTPLQSRQFRVVALCTLGPRVWDWGPCRWSTRGPGSPITRLPGMPTPCFGCMRRQSTFWKRYWDSRCQTGCDGCVIGGSITVCLFDKPVVVAA